MQNADRFPTFYAAGRLLGRLWPFFRWGWRLARPALAALVVLGLAAYVVGNVSAGRELEREMALVREQGEPLTLAEAAPRPVPDEENAALVYERAFSALPRLEDGSPVGGVRERPLAREEDKILSDFFNVKPEIRSRVTIEQIRHILVGTEDALELARQAAAMPRCRFPVDWEAGAGALFPHYAKLRSLTRLLAAHAVVAAVDGQTGEAVSDLEAVVGLARHCGEPVLIGQLVQYACLTIGHEALERVLEATSPNEAECRRLAQTLAEVELYSPFERAITMERAFGMWCFDAWRRDPGQVTAAIQGGEDGRPFFPDRIVERVLRSELLIKKDQILYLRYMAGKVALARQRRHVPDAGLSPDEVQFPLYSPLTRIITPVYTNVQNKRDESVTRLGLARWALALHAYRGRAGRYPQQLKEVEALLEWELPNDPFTGQPLLYRRQGEGYLLYSAGANARDDNGRNDRTEPRRPPLNPGPQGPPSAGWDDIAWRTGR